MYGCGRLVNDNCLILIGEMSELLWDITDDDIMQIHSEGKYGELLADSAIYILIAISKLIWYMASKRLKFSQKQWIVIWKNSKLLE